MEINAYIYIQMIFNKGAKTTQWGKEESFQQMVLGQLDIFLHLYLTLPKKYQLKIDQRLNLRAKITNVT